VSIRSKEEIYVRHARDGFWHFPGERPWSTPEDLVRATLRTVRHLPPGEQGKRLVESSHIAVTFFSALERCTVGQLDNDRYGIVVCSEERPSTMGGALPRMPGIGDEWRQFQHARVNNAQLFSFEPYAIYRHEVSKHVEPGATWQPSGVPLESEAPWHQNPNICGRLAERARDLVASKRLGASRRTGPLPDDLLPPGIEWVFITIYFRGQLRGCMGAPVDRIDDEINKLIDLALDDARFSTTPDPEDEQDLALTVSFLFNPLELGPYTPDEAPLRFKLGKQALMAHQGSRSGLLLPFVAATHNLNRVEFVAEVIDKAGITRPPYNWRRYDCATWLADSKGSRVLDGAFPASGVEPPARVSVMLDRLAALHTRYLIRHLDPERMLFCRYEPFQNRLYRSAAGAWTARFAHAAWILTRASRLLGGPALESASGAILDPYLSLVQKTSEGTWIEAGEAVPTVAEAAFLLLALCELQENDQRREQAAGLADTLWSSIGVHGRITTHRPPADSPELFQDYFPGQVILALAAAAQAGLGETREADLRRAFRYYRHRFRYQRDFGQVSWLMQAFARWCEVTGKQEFADLVFEIGDWILEYQQEKTGAFINDHQPDSPGYTTALYLEGIGAAVRLAKAIGDGERFERYLASYMRGLQFIDRLTIQERETSLLPNPDYAIGGVRQSIYRSEVRIDFVQHALSAVLELMSERVAVENAAQLHVS
jgi:uncharacterized protein (TIGR00296 family)